MPSGKAYLVLRSGPEQRDDALTWEVLYLAGDDASELARPDAQEALAAFAQDLLGAFSPIAELAQVGRLSVTAAFGKPGGSAATERLSFTRDAAGWHADASAAERAVAQFPTVDTEVARDPQEEASARDAAAEFISNADRADYDAAWAKTSARVKAMMSRADFERHLEGLPEPDGASERDIFVSFEARVKQFLPGASMMAWVARATAGGPVVETLELRLDDDMEWRISGVAELAPPPSESAVLGQGRTPTETGSAH
jgi:hypothetical protein